MTEADRTDDMFGAEMDSRAASDLVNQVSNRRFSANDMFSADREQSNLKDVSVSSDERLQLASAEVSIEARLAPVDTPAPPRQDIEALARSGDRWSSSLPIEVNEVKITGEGGGREGFGSERQPLAAIPIATGAAATQIKNGAEFGLPVEQRATIVEAKTFDVAALAATDLVRPRNGARPVNDITLDDSVRNAEKLPRLRESLTVEAPKAAPVTAAPTIEQKTLKSTLDGGVLLGAEEASRSGDEAEIVERRPGSLGDAGRPAPSTATAPLITTTAPSVAPVMAEGLPVEESVAARIIEADAISTANIVGERAAIQFAPPNATPPASAAWAQVISAISERNGEAKLELRLNPPELGRVIIGFESNGADLIRAVVSAENPQTLDLMRRNLDILQRELARSGLDHVDVELADRDSRSHAQDANEKTLAYASSDEAPAHIEARVPLPSFIADGRLDLRV